MYHRQSQKSNTLAILFLYYNLNHGAPRIGGVEGIKQKLRQLEQKTLYVQAKLWNKLTQHALTMKEGSFIISGVMVYAPAVNSQRFALGGAFASMLDKLSSAYLNLLVIVVYCWAYHNRYAGVRSVYVFVLLIRVIYAQNVPDYIFLCNTYYQYEVECNHYQFDDKTCFLWNVFNCSITQIDFNEICLKYDCSVKTFI